MDYVHWNEHFSPSLLRIDKSPHNESLMAKKARQRNGKDGMIGYRLAIRCIAQSPSQRNVTNYTRRSNTPGYDTSLLEYAEKPILANAVGNWYSFVSN